MVVKLKDEFRSEITATTLDLGLTPHADDMDVIDLASRRHAIVVTVDDEYPKKIRIYQEHAKTCLYGLLLLPDGIEHQRRLLTAVRQGTKQIRHTRCDRPLSWADIHADNFLVKLHKGSEPEVEELCNCSWDED